MMAQPINADNRQMIIDEIIDDIIPEIDATSSSVSNIATDSVKEAAVVVNSPIPKLDFQAEEVLQIQQQRNIMFEIGGINSETDVDVDEVQQHQQQEQEQQQQQEQEQQQQQEQEQQQQQEQEQQQQQEQEQQQQQEQKQQLQQHQQQCQLRQAQERRQRRRQQIENRQHVQTQTQTTQRNAKIFQYACLLGIILLAIKYISEWGTINVVFPDPPVSRKFEFEPFLFKLGFFIFLAVVCSFWYKQEQRLARQRLTELSHEVSVYFEEGMPRL